MLRKLTIVGFFVATIGASLLLVASARSGGPLSFAREPREQPNPNVATVSPAPPIEAEIIVLRPWGFEPKEISRPPGPFFLALDNRSGLNQPEVSLDMETGPKLYAIGVSKNKSKWREKMALPPGTYLLREAGHPDWVCRITIQP
jgi:hypothetical protein